jgi:hypothetical protein
MRGNRNPSPATRFQPGHPGGPGRPSGREVLPAKLRAKTLAEAKQQSDAFQGSPREFLLCAMIDPRVDDHIRLAAAGQLLRDTKDWDDGEKLTPAQRKQRIVELVQKLAYGSADTASAQQQPNPPLLEGYAEPSHGSPNGASDE